jgi:DNA-directed RNA polymerase subunit alpha
MFGFDKYLINLNTKDISDQHAKITISNLEKGMGITIGNAIRRAMLLFVPGCSMFAIKISGVTHEFQTISGIYEDITQIILNLKGLVISIDDKIFSDDEIKKTKIEN